MSLFIYNLFTRGYFLAIHLASIFSEKAGKWVNGRKSLFSDLEKAFSFQKTDSQQVVWMHCASLGEFEQGRTVLEALKKERPGIKILLTFFSPSGYEIRKDYKMADWVFYLPADSPINAKRFLKTVRPSLSIFVKYEFWYHFLFQLKEANIPTLLISAAFRKSQPFFKWYGKLYRKMLRCFDEIFVQEKGSAELLAAIGIKNVQVAGDTRIDRVVEIGRQAVNFPRVEKFCEGSPVLVCGSTWEKDEETVSAILNNPAFEQWKILLAPHDISKKRIAGIMGRFGEVATLYSTEKDIGPPKKRVLVIDTIGMLSRLYFYGRVAYIGGGFGQGIHNTLEPMAFGLPVVYGPRWQKFTEASQMIKRGGHFAVKSQKGFVRVMQDLTSGGAYGAARGQVEGFVQNNKGSTQVILKCIERCF